MIIYLVMEMSSPRDYQRAAYLKEASADAECDRLLKALPRADGFYVEPLEVNEQ